MTTTYPRAELWQQVDLAPIPRTAPPYRLLPNTMTARIWVAGYDARPWRTTYLDQRWLHDTARTSPVEVAWDEDADTVPEPRRGDLIVWVGIAHGGPSKKHEPFVWSPSLITSVTVEGDRVRVEGVRDGWMNGIDLDVMSDAYPDIDWSSVLEAAEPPFQAGTDLLDAWGLNVWCPECGHLGRAATWGYPGMEGARDEPGHLLPWPVGVDSNHGCCVPEDMHAWDCERCGHQWGTPPIAEQGNWPTGEEWDTFTDEIDPTHSWAE